MTCACVCVTNAFLLLLYYIVEKMIGLNAVFGFTAAFLNSYINGQVVPVALNDPDSKYIGLLSSVVPMVAAAMSLFFGRISPIIGCLLYTSPSPRDPVSSRMPSSA